MRANSGEFHFYSDPITKSRHWIFEPRQLSDVINYFNIDPELTSLLIQAHYALGRLEGISKYVPHMEYFEDMIIRHEVCMSCSVDNMLITPAGMFNSGVNAVNKCCAVNLFQAAKSFEIQPLSIEFLCRLHEKVMKEAVWGTSGRLRAELFLMHPYFHADMEDYNPPLPERLNELLDDMVKFFVRGIITSAELAIKQIDLANALREENLHKMMLLEKSVPLLSSLCDYLEQKPLVSVQEIADVLQISYNTATKYVKMMEELEILKQINEQSRYRIFYYDNYIKIFTVYIEEIQ